MAYCCCLGVTFVFCLELLFNGCGLCLIVMFAGTLIVGSVVVDGWLYVILFNCCMFICGLDCCLLI